jgi:two-component system response regulator HydG
MGTVLVVEDQKAMRSTMAAMLRGAGHEVAECATSAEALSLHTRTPFELVLTDLRLDGGDGLGLLRRLRALTSAPEVIVVTAYSTIESAVEAMRTGAFDYLPKPFSPSELTVRVERALETSRLRRDVVALAAEFRDRYRFENIVAKSTAMREVVGRLVRLAPLRHAVFLSGPSGSGKEFIAKALHASGTQPARPFVVVAVAGRSEASIDTELFGSAADGAARRGLLEDIDGGTVFIDEVADLPLGTQAKLARFVETFQLRSPVDGVTRAVDTRLILATIASPEDLLNDRRLRSDLYYACAGGRVHVPGLAEREHDLVDLAHGFAADAAKRLGKRVALHERALEALQRMEFRGNVRELAGVIARAVEEVPDGGMIFGDEFVQERPVPTSASTTPQARAAMVVPLDRAVDDAEQVAILAALREVDGSRERAAELLGISPTTLWRKMTRLNIVFDSRVRLS